jgi:hypothetical protein
MATKKKITVDAYLRLMTAFIAGLGKRKGC